MPLFTLQLRQKTPEELLLEQPLPPELAYAYGKLAKMPGPPGTAGIGPPYALDQEYSPPPATMGDLMHRVGTFRAIQEVMPKPPPLPEWKPFARGAMKLPPPGSFEQPEFAMPPPDAKTSTFTDAEGRPWALTEGGQGPPSAVRFPGEFPTKGEESFEPPYPGPEGSLLQRSKTGKVSSVLGRRGEGGSAADTQEFREVKEAADFVLRFAGDLPPNVMMMVTLNPKSLSEPAVQNIIKNRVPSHLRPVYDQMVRKLEKYYKVEGKTFTYDRDKRDIVED